MNLLEELIRHEIGSRGPMRFDRFMGLALYHSEHGYYARPRAIGRGGDFFTSVSVGPLFGRILAWQAREMAGYLEESVFTIVEQGANDGRLARDILEETRNWQRFTGELRYLIIEPNAYARAVQENMLADFAGQVNWRTDLETKGNEKPAGLFLSNELVDALPVRLIEAEGGVWKERCVSTNDEQALSWKLAPIDAELERAISELPLVASDGYRTEISLAARSWMRSVAGFMRRGYVLTIDYGFPASIYYAPERQAGTLTCYREHQHGDNVFDYPGRQDITAHVDFTALARAGSERGWEPIGFVDQQRFLTAMFGAHGEELNESNVRAFHTLTHPSFLGARFHALVQAKDAPRDLLGLKFSRPNGLD